MSDILIIGAGHNGLVAAYYLARAGFKPTVLERRPAVGGAAITEEIAPGHRVPALAHATGPLRESIVRDMDLAKRVEFLRADPRLVALDPDGPALVFYGDVRRTAEAIRSRSEADADRYPDFCETLQRLSGFLAPMLTRRPPSIDELSTGALWDLLKTGRQFRRLGRADAYRLLRWMPMAAADLVGEWFTSDLLQAAVAARGVFGTAAGPWSGGTGAVLLMHAAMDPVPGGSSVTVKGGPGALTRAMADEAEAAGATIRLGAPVTQITVQDGRTAGVLLADGSEIPARAVISSADPRRTFLELVDPLELEPGFLQRLRNYRSHGTLAKVNLILGALPEFRGVAGPDDLHGRIHVGPDLDYLERAFDASKYGELSPDPMLDVAIPSLADPSLCPPGRHVMSVYVQFAPYKLARNGDWTALRDSVGTTVLRTLEHYAPGIGSLIEDGQILTPLDLEAQYGLTGGHIMHGELSLDQLWMMRPVLGWAHYRSPIEGLFLCGAGTHPGGGLTGASGRNAARAVVGALNKRAL